MVSNLEIAGVTVEAGTKTRGNLRAGPYFGKWGVNVRRWVLIPFTIIRGKNDGPIFCATAGNHPTEYAGIDATAKLCNLISPDELKGTFITIHCVNPPGFFARTYINPIDGQNVPELYPGKANGTISEMMAYRVFNDVLIRCNAHIDLHGGCLPESLVWYVIYRGSNDDVGRRSEALAKAVGFKYLNNRATEGRSGLLAERGIPSLTFECNTGSKLVPEESAAITEGVLNMMRHLGMLPGPLKEIKDQPNVPEDGKTEIWTKEGRTFCTQGGLCEYTYKPGDLLKKGQVMGVIRNFYGDVVETILAPETGRIRIMVHNPVKNPGDAFDRVCY